MYEACLYRRACRRHPQIRMGYGDMDGGGLALAPVGTSRWGPMQVMDGAGMEGSVRRLVQFAVTGICVMRFRKANGDRVWV